VFLFECVEFRRGEYSKNKFDWISVLFEGERYLLSIWKGTKLGIN